MGDADRRHAGSRAWLDGPAEFEEYRPYEAMSEFRREIGKYVDEEQVERLAGYVTIR